MVCPNQRAEFALYNSYVMDVDQGNRNCYSCRGFGHLARTCRNKETRNRIGKGRRLEYRNNGQDNLNGEEDLIIFD